MTLGLKEKLAMLKQKAAMAKVESVAAIPAQVEVQVQVAPQEFPATPLGELQLKLAELRTMLLQDHPLIPKLLQTIHAVMLEQGDLVVCLSDEEIGVFIQGLKNHMQVTVISEKAKKATSSAALKKATATELSGGMDDLAALAASLGVKM